MIAFPLQQTKCLVQGVEFSRFYCLASIGFRIQDQLYDGFISS